MRGRRAVASILGVRRGLVLGHISDYHRVFRGAAWVFWLLANVLPAFVVALAEDHGVEGWLLVAKQP